MGVAGFVSTFMAKKNIGELLLMEINQFKYVSDENRKKKPSPPKQFEVRVLLKPQPSLTQPFEVAFVSTERVDVFSFFLSVQTGCLVYVYVRNCYYRPETPLRFS